MKLSKEDATYFNQLFSRFLIFANKDLKTIDNLVNAKDLLKINPFKQLELRKLIYENMNHYIDLFIENENLTEEEKKDVESWKNFVNSRFIVYRHLKNHSIFIGIESEAKVYGVLGLLDDMDKVIPSHTLPMVVEGNLLPFRDKIIYDGMLGAAEFNDSILVKLTKVFIDNAKENKQLIKSLPKENSVSSENDWAGDEEIYLINSGETFVRTNEKIGRNDPCTCGSGKKYKKCCGK